MGMIFCIDVYFKYTANTITVFVSFQAVFVVLVNFQGIYIFLFYCVRSSDVRGQWTSLLSSSPSSDTSLPHSNKPSEKSTAAE